jgi:hypothetical protein
VSAALVAALVAGCGSGSSHNADRQTFQAYLHTIEPLRVGVDKLLDGADPILAAYSDHRAGVATTQRRLQKLERRFVDYARQVAAVRPVPPVLWSAHRAYAHTYVLEDRYLRALIAAVPGRQWRRLPHFEQAQRQVLVAWRGAVALEAARVGAPLPADIQIAGRGELAPSPEGDS